MPNLITSATFTDVDLNGTVSMQPPGAALITYVNSTGRNVALKALIVVDALNAAAAVMTIHYKGTFNGGSYFAADDPGISKSVDTSLSFAMWSKEIVVPDGDTVIIQLHSSNASDTTTPDGEIFLYDMNSGIDVRAVGAATPITQANIDSSVNNNSNGSRFV